MEMEKNPISLWHQKQEEALFYERLLKRKINGDREAHEKKPLKEKMALGC